MQQKVSAGEKHLTASVWIVSETSPKKILLVHHKKYNKWLQPGGHVEPFENPLETAIREVKEETGIDISFLRDEIVVVDEEGTFLPKPAYLMEQTIAAHKEQPKHYHIDVMYVVTVSEQALTHAVSESHGIGWFTKDEALLLPTHADTRIILDDIL
jgi:8-oxo-dGTP pyrophosphatase MutT (NUDIX family)